MLPAGYRLWNDFLWGTLTGALVSAGLLGLAFVRSGMSAAPEWWGMAGKFVTYCSVIGAFVGLWRRWLLNLWVAAIVGAVAGAAAFAAWELATGKGIRNVDTALCQIGALVGGGAAICLCLQERRKEAQRK